jgi:histidine ammonia-lyase
MRQNDNKAVLVGEGRLTIEHVFSIAANGSNVRLPDDPAFSRRINAGAELIEKLLAENGVIYGVTTGYGDSCTTAIPADLVRALPLNLTRYHRCGLGSYLTEDQCRAVLACRLNSLAQGFSGVRHKLLDQIAALINNNVLPLIPSEGSVGASGDLTPLAYVAAAIAGEGLVLHQGLTRPADEVLAELRLPVLSLAPKEGLAVMNGTAVMTALACMAWTRAEYLSRLCCRLTAMSSISIDGNREHFDPVLFSVKPHAGQIEAASWIFEDLAACQTADNSRLQDRYSIRCAPHVIGVLRDALVWMRRDIVDCASGRILHGGHFYGGHIAFAMDGLKSAVASVADLMDRQLALLVDTRFNNGLPQNLSGASPARSAINHGLKGVQISASAWTAEALKLTMPATAFSRSTECHNQDKVSMGTIAARDCLRILELTEQVAAALIFAVRQGVHFRQNTGEGKNRQLSDPVADFHARLSEALPLLTEDRPLESELRELTQQIQGRHWTLYA